MTALWLLGVVFVAGWTAHALFGALQRPRRNRLELPGDRVWPSRRRAK